MYIFTVEEVIVMWTLGITNCQLVRHVWFGQCSLVDACKQLTFASEWQINQHTGNFHSVDKIDMISTFGARLQTIRWRECPVNSQTTKCDYLSPNLDGSYPQFIPCLSHEKKIALLHLGQPFWPWKVLLPDLDLVHEGNITQMLFGWFLT